MLTDEQLYAWWRLRHLKGVGNIAINELLSRLSHPADLLSASADDLIAYGIAPALAHQWLTDASALYSGRSSTDSSDLALNPAHGFAALQAWRAHAEHPDQGVLFVGDPNYPPALASLRDAPTFLWYRGQLECLNKPMLAMVGSRGATPAALEWTRQQACLLAEAGVTVVSGLALGVDGAAHQGALMNPNVSAATIAVMGTGADIIYPSRHRPLGDEIAQRGLLLTEFSPGTGAQSRHFPSRNRIISGLCQATLIVEANLRSGTMITARMAADQGRDVLVLPGAVANPLARGPHQLIREGATLVENASDILEVMQTAPMPQSTHVQGIAKPKAEIPTQLAIETTATEPATTEPPQLVSMIDFHVTPVDVIALRSGQAIASLLPALLQLELDGWIEQAPGGYCRKR